MKFPSKERNWSGAGSKRGSYCVLGSCLELKMLKTPVSDQLDGRDDLLLESIFFGLLIDLQEGSDRHEAV